MLPLHKPTAAATAAAATAAAAPSDVRELVMARVRKHFQPEFLNRIDEFICFEPLR
jgi:ATP-dependent Clp protease ATP-binding subunit ClpA